MVEMQPHTTALLAVLFLNCSLYMPQLLMKCFLQLLAIFHNQWFLDMHQDTHFWFTLSPLCVIMTHILSRLALVCLLANLRSVLHQIVNEIAFPGVVRFTEALQLDSTSGMRGKNKGFQSWRGKTHTQTDAHTGDWVDTFSMMLVTVRAFCISLAQTQSQRLTLLKESRRNLVCPLLFLLLLIIICKMLHTHFRHIKGVVHPKVNIHILLLFQACCKNFFFLKQLLYDNS